MKILITGGAGFIGKYLIKSLIGSEHKITIFDNFSNSSKKSILHFLSNKIKIIEGDIRNKEEVILATKDQDLIIHLAAKISVQESIKNPDETYDVNVDGTKNILNACNINDVKKIIIASSAAVYGERSSSSKISEDTEKKPISIYGDSKLKMEDIIKEISSQDKINYIILRFFNIYGIGQSQEYAGVITKFQEKIKQNEVIKIFGDGLQTRDFVSVKDVTNAINISIKNNNVNGIYNIASGNSITIKELAEKMILNSGKKIKIGYSTSKNNDIKYSHADISLAKEKLGYRPQIIFEEEIKELLNSI